MIRLSETKTLDNYFIDENGVITDEKGNVQKLNLQAGRFRFKGVAVHKIQMWTNYGWRDGYKWIIHHKDENKLNNSLENLVFLTPKEHMSLHKKGKKGTFEGKNHTNETKAKISAAKKGKKTWNEGKNHTNETKAKISAALKGKLKGTIIVNNGAINKRVYVDQIPNGFVKGRIKNK